MRLSFIPHSNCLMKHDVLIIGGGAAGLFCAAEAGKRGRSVLVIEHADRVGKKIAVSGGGRCNFTNLHTAPENFLSANPRFCRSALARYTPEDFIALVERHGIRYHEKKLGQLFCDGSSRQIVDMLLGECEQAGVEIKVDCRVSRVDRESDFVAHTNQGTFEAESLVVASGGLSIPKIGATDFGYRIARQFGLKVVEPRPALVPLTLNPTDLHRLNPLSGVSLAAEVVCRGARFEESILLTHRGLSGPAILQISSYWQPGESLDINLLPGLDVHQQLIGARRGTHTLAALLTEYLPRRFAQTWCETHASSRPLNQYSSKELAEIAVRLQQWRIDPSGTEGFQKAEVTAGGVDSDELSSKTMEAKRAPGLFFIGEVVDVTGHLGGYNFQWAWASGFAAGQYV